MTQCFRLVDVMLKFSSMFFLLVAGMFVVSCGSSSSFKEPAATTTRSEVNIYRPTDMLTVTQGVKVAVDDKFVDKLWHGQTLQFNVTQGIHEVETSVGLSFGLPNITGFNGARAYERSFKFKAAKHYFKITFKPGLLVGQHVISEIDIKEFEALSKN